MAYETQIHTITLEITGIEVILDCLKEREKRLQEDLLNSKTISNYFPWIKTQEDELEEKIEVVEELIKTIEGVVRLNNF